MAYYDHSRQKKSPIYTIRSKLFCKTIIDMLSVWGVQGPVLEIGIGRGELYRELKTMYPSVYAMDCSDECLSHADLGRGYFGKLPDMPIDGFGLVVVVHVLEHLTTHDDVLKSLEAISKSLLKPGFVLVVFPDYLAWGKDFWDVDYSHGVPLTDRRMRQLATDTGLSILESTVHCGIWTGFPAWVAFWMWRLFPLRRVHHRIRRLGYSMNIDRIYLLGTEP